MSKHLKDLLYRIVVFYSAIHLEKKNYIRADYDIIIDTCKKYFRHIQKHKDKFAQSKYKIGHFRADLTTALSRKVTSSAKTKVLNLISQIYPYGPAGRFYISETQQKQIVQQLQSLITRSKADVKGVANKALKELKQVTEVKLAKPPTLRKFSDVFLVPLRNDYTGTDLFSLAPYLQPFITLGNEIRQKVRKEDLQIDLRGQLLILKAVHEQVPSSQRDEKFYQAFKVKLKERNKPGSRRLLFGVLENNVDSYFSLDESKLKAYKQAIKSVKKSQPKTVVDQNPLTDAEKQDLKTLLQNVVKNSFKQSEFKSIAKKLRVSLNSVIGRSIKATKGFSLPRYRQYIIDRINQTLESKTQVSKSVQSEIVRNLDRVFARGISESTSVVERLKVAYKNEGLKGTALKKLSNSLSSLRVYKKNLLTAEGIKKRIQRLQGVTDEDKQKAFKAVDKVFSRDSNIGLSNEQAISILSRDTTALSPEKKFSFIIQRTIGKKAHKIREVLKEGSQKGLSGHNLARFVYGHAARAVAKKQRSIAYLAKITSALKESFGDFESENYRKIYDQLLSLEADPELLTTLKKDIASTLRHSRRSSDKEFANQFLARVAKHGNDRLLAKAIVAVELAFQIRFRPSVYTKIFTDPTEAKRYGKLIQQVVQKRNEESRAATLRSHERKRAERLAAYDKEVNAEIQRELSQPNNVPSLDEMIAPISPIRSLSLDAPRSPRLPIEPIGPLSLGGSRPLDASLDSDILADSLAEIDKNVVETEQARKSKQIEDSKKLIAISKRIKNNPAAAGDISDYLDEEKAFQYRTPARIIFYQNFRKRLLNGEDPIESFKIVAGESFDDGIRALATDDDFLYDFKNFLLEDLFSDV